jgi:hypothetical protein
MIKEKCIGEQSIKIDYTNYPIAVWEVGNYNSDSKGKNVLKYLIAYKYYFNDTLALEYPLEQNHRLSLREAILIKDTLNNYLKQNIEAGTLKPIFQQNLRRGK